MSKDKIKVVGICGSLRNISYTRFSVKIALEAAEKMGAEVKLIDLRDYNLPFVEQFEEDDQPEDLQKYRDEVASADAIILGTPEYHGGYTGIIKNAIDLLNRNVFDNTTVGLIGIAGGSLGATNSLNGLRQITRHLHAWTIPQHVSIPNAYDKFDDEGNIKDDGIKKRLIEVGELVVKHALLLKNI